jgi:hypothetical protein
MLRSSACSKEYYSGHVLRLFVGIWRKGRHLGANVGHLFRGWLECIKALLINSLPLQYKFALLAKDIYSFGSILLDIGRASRSSSLYRFSVEREHVMTDRTPSANTCYRHVIPAAMIVLESFCLHRPGIVRWSGGEVSSPRLRRLHLLRRLPPKWV